MKWTIGFIWTIGFVLAALATSSEAAKQIGDGYFDTFAGLTTDMRSPEATEISYGFHVLDTQSLWWNMTFQARLVVAPVQKSAGGGFGFGITPPLVGQFFTTGFGVEARGWDKNSYDLDKDGIKESGDFEMSRVFLSLRGRPDRPLMGGKFYPELDFGVEGGHGEEEGRYFLRVGTSFDIN